MIKTLLTVAVLAASLSSAQAVIVWTGAADTNIFNDANWDFSGSGVGTISSNTSIADNVIITNGTASIPNEAGQVRFQLGDGFTLTLDNSTVSPVANDGIGGAPGGTGVTVDVINGSQLNPFFIVNGVTANIDATSSANFGGGGTPINISTVNLVNGAQLTLASAAEFNEQGQRIFVNGNQYDSNGSTPGGANDALWDNLGTTRTAVPEPSGIALLGLAGVALIFRRRK